MSLIFEHQNHDRKAQANSEDSDQTASHETIWSDPSLYAILTNILWFKDMIAPISWEL